MDMSGKPIKQSEDKLMFFLAMFFILAKKLKHSKEENDRVLFFFFNVYVYVCIHMYVYIYMTYINIYTHLLLVNLSYRRPALSCFVLRSPLITSALQTKTTKYLTLYTLECLTHFLV